MSFLPPPNASDTVIILVRADVNSIGIVHYTSYFLGGDGTPITGPIIVQSGDRVGWYVQVVSKTLSAKLPYEITFTDTSMFGVASLSAPQGGGSGYLVVLPTINGLKTKFSVRVSGINQSYDPEMQTDTSGPRNPNRHKRDVTPSAYVINWYPDVDSAKLTCTKDGQNQTFPLTLSPLDTVVFFATGEYAAPDFLVQFQPTNGYWLSPFGPADNYLSTGSQGDTSFTDILTVGDVKPADKSFTFYLTNGSVQSDPQVMIVL